MLDSDFDVTGTETVRQTGQAFLEKLRPSAKADPAEQGATPFPEASDITGLALRYHPGSEIDFLEPCVGTGIFFSALLHHVADRHGTLNIHTAHGVERDDQFAALAHDLWAPAGLEVLLRDFLRLSSSDLPQASMVLSRPPATFHHRLSSDAKVRAADAAETSSGIRPTGMADLYSHFVLATHKFLAPKAVSAWVLPTKFLRHSSGRALRLYLAKHVTLHRIHAYDARAFDVTRLEETIDEWSVVVFTNELPHASDAFEFSVGGDLFDPNETTHMPYARLSPEINWLQLADLDEDNSPTKSYTLEDFFFIRSGWEVPAPKFFVQPETRAWALGIQPMHMHPLLPHPTAVTGKTITADEWGWPASKHRHVVLASNKDEYTLAELDPAFLRYLDAANGDTRQAAQRSHDALWYNLHLRRPAPIVVKAATEADDGLFRFILNQSDGIAGPGWITMSPSLGFAKPWFLNNDVNWSEVIEILESIRLPDEAAKPTFSPDALASLDATPLVEYLANFD
ncbi:hypothetical protein [Enteractinococcus coprophilus]|uniref:hypothetical protein n=1 Tax=Enteractinococcus coprophilus TaxID=1027633 RepID=UPI00114E2430|nr:hypothetical protein [Enteractinococcus coprophilus]